MIVKIKSPSEWLERARCRGMNPDIFHPTRGQPTKPATDICYLCPVRVECAEYAIAHSIKQGIWGGFSEHNRRKIRRARLIARKKGLVKGSRASTDIESTETE